MATRTSHLVRPLVVRPLLALVALVAAMAALLLAYGASPTHAAGSCSTTAGTTTCTFGPTGAEDTFEVPAGVSSIHVVATGAPGAVGTNGSPAGRGATVSGDLTVRPGQTLYVEVGGAPIVTGDCFPGVACIGGFNGGGSAAAFGGGGGGASDVRTVSRVQSASLASRLIVAGGGGGSGNGADCEDPGVADPMGGAGGDAGSFTAGGGLGCGPGGIGGSTGGSGGTQSAGGVGGSPDGNSGALGQGGDGGNGGGGGGGYYGGGSGGDGVVSDDDPITTSAAGGGGGGSNLVPEGGSAVIITSGDPPNPSIVISYKAGVGEEPPTEPEDKQACKKGGYETLGFKNQGQCIKAVNANNR